MENVNTMFALITGMAISVSLALMLEKAVFTSVMRLMVSSPMMIRTRPSQLSAARKTRSY